jgi:hypothetical protein
MPTMNFMTSYWKNSRRGYLKTLSALSISVVFLFSCSNDTGEFGKDVLPGDDFVDFISTDSFQITARTIDLRQFYSAEVDTILVGGYTDEAFGSVKVSSIVELLPRYFSDGSFLQDARLDSIVPFDTVKIELTEQPYLQLVPSGNYGTAQSLIQNIHVFEVLDEFDKTEYSNSNADISALNIQLLNDGFNTLNTRGEIVIPLPDAFTDRLLAPYVNKEYYVRDSLNRITDTLFGIYFNSEEILAELNGLYFESSAPYSEYVSGIDIRSNQTRLVFPITVQNDGEDLPYFIYFGLKSVALDEPTFSANYFEFNSEGTSDIVQAINDTLLEKEKLYIQSNRTEALISLEGLDAFKPAATENAIVTKAILKIPVDNMDNAADRLSRPRRLSLRYSDGEIVPDDPQNQGEIASFEFLNRFNGIYNANDGEYVFDLSLHAEAYLNGLTTKNEFVVFVPDHELFAIDVLDTTIYSKTKADRVILNSHIAEESPISFELYYSTVDK